MRTIHVLRKPCSRDTGTVAANVLKYGCGGLNIDASRISGGVGYADEVARNIASFAQLQAKSPGWKNSSPYKPNVDGALKGRWPANVVFQHLDGCKQTGTREEPGYSVNRFTDGAKPFGGGAGHPYESEHVPPSTVPVWACAEGCPVAALDAQSGTSKSVSTPRRNAPGVMGYGGRFRASTLPGPPTDEGGASRFFKQFGG